MSNDTPLIYAAQNGFFDIIQLLLSRSDIKINLKNIWASISHNIPACNSFYEI